MQRVAHVGLASAPGLLLWTITKVLLDEYGLLARSGPTERHAHDTHPVQDYPPPACPPLGFPRFPLCADAAAEDHRVPHGRAWPSV
jgi:hypothetical protein